MFFGLLSFDDDYNILLNSAVKSFNLREIWFNPYYGMYIPVVYSAWAVLAQIYFDSSINVFHVFNLALHLFNAFQVFYIISWLLKKYESRIAADIRIAAALATFFFICHPMQVETVVWVSAARDLLSVSFALVAFRFYLTENSLRNIFVATLLFGLGLLSKPSVAPLPVILVLTDFILNRTMFKKSIFNLSGMFLLSLSAVILAGSIQSDQIAKRIFPASLSDRILSACKVFYFYIEKLFLPINLSADYGQLENSQSFRYIWVTSILSLGLIGFTFLRNLRVQCVISKLGIMIFLFAIIPALGFIPFFYQSLSLVADRYMYFPLFGISLIVASACNSRFRQGLFFAVILIFTFLSAHRTRVWENDNIFFAEMIRSNSLSSTGYLGLGYHLTSIGNLDLAFKYLRTAVALDPKNAVPSGNLYLVMNRLGMYDSVIDLGSSLVNDKEFIRINEFTAGLAQVFSGLGFAQFNKMRYEESFKSYCNAVIHNPEGGNELLGLEKIKSYVNLKSCP